ncbi:MAG: hypothetical protein ACREBS_04660 [Nitrososphaerales archaeon]
MRNNIIKYVSSVGVGVGLTAVYFAFLARYLALANWSSLSEIETLILTTQIMRVLFVFTLSKRLHLPPLVAIIMFSFEAFLIPVLAPLVILTGNPAYATLMGTILTTWIAVSALVLSPYAIQEFAKSMIAENSLSAVMAIATLEMGGMLFLASIISRTNSPITGLTALGSLLILTGKDQVSSVGFANLGSSVLISLGLVVFYLSMASYFSLGVHLLDTKIRLSYAYALPLAGTIVALFFISALVRFNSSVLIVLTIPIFVSAAAIWGSTRGK